MERMQSTPLICNTVLEEKNCWSKRGLTAFKAIVFLLSVPQRMSMFCRSLKGLRRPSCPAREGCLSSFCPRQPCKMPSSSAVSMPMSISCRSAHVGARRSTLASLRAPLRDAPSPLRLLPLPLLLLLLWLLLRRPDRSPPPPPPPGLWLCRCVESE